MKSPLVTSIVAVLCLLLLPLAASASPIKTFVKDFAVAAPGQEGLKTTLKTLLVSRLRGDGIDVIESETDADVVVSGSYTQLGKTYSIDALARTSSGKQVAAAYEQGDSPDTVIAAVGKLAARLQGEILKAYPAATAPAPVSAAPVAPPAPLPVAAPVPAAVLPGAAVWTSQRLPGAQSSLAAGGANQLLTANADSIRLYQKGATLTLATEIGMPPRLKIIGIDRVTIPEYGVLLFVSAIDGDAPASRVYQVGDNSLKLLSERLPYLFRAVALNGGASELFAQQMSTNGEFYGDVYPAALIKGELKLGKAIKMPRFANVYNFNMVRDAAGKTYLLAFTESGYLTVYADDGKELWRSDDKYGGSEAFIMGHDADNERFYANADKPRFLNQRIVVSERGEIIVPQNTGFLVVGNRRSYSKYSIAAFTWNGSTLEELWRTKQAQSYLADYFFDPASREFTVLEVPQKEGVFGKGASTIKVIRAQ